MSNKINIEQIEEHLKQAGLENGELENLLNPIKELNNQRRYGLVWEEPDDSTYNTDSAEQELLKNFPFLKEVNEHRIFNGEQHPDHLLIEGDNLHALKTMQYTHKNEIDVIYIDPPYNTGNTDFVYNDKYVDNEDSWRHSKWLSFMNKRLRLARELMTDEGVIFISIDDNEMAQLKLLCDQVFGEENVETMIWHKVGDGDAGAGKMKVTHRFRREHEYVITAYRDKKRIKFDKYLSVPDFKNEYKNLDDDPRGAFKAGNISKTEAKSKVDGKNYYRVTSPDGKKTYNRQWHFDKDEFDRLNEDGRIYWGKSGNGVPQIKIFINEPRPTTPVSILQGFGSSTSASKVVGKSMGLGFDNPKPLELIEYLINLHPNKNATVLDFFAGSGTTTHAVMELNEEDGGNRQAIVITNNEINSSEEEDFLVEKGYVEPFTGSRRGTKKHAKWLEKINEFKETTEYKELIETDEYKDLGIARAVTEQRINKVINGYTTPKNKEVEGLDDNNFYHFEVELEPDLIDDDLNTYMLINKTKDIIKVKENVYTDEVDISTDNIPAIKLANDEKEVIVVLSVRVAETDIEQLINNFTGSDKERIIYTSYTGYEYGINNIRFEELPKELLQAIKHNENN